MNFWIVGIAVFLVILISIQYSLNKMVMLLREIRDILYKMDIKN